MEKRDTRSLNKSSFTKIMIKGILPSIHLEDAINYFPWLKPIVEKIISRGGWNIKFIDCRGTALIGIDLSNASFRMDSLTHIDDPRHRYELKIRVPEDKVSIVYIDELRECNMSLDYMEQESVIIAKIPSKEITHLFDPLWDIARRQRISFNFLYEMIDVVKILLDNGFYPSKNVVDTLSSLLKLLKARTFKLEINATILDPDKVPPYDELVKELIKFFKERGIIVSFEKSRRKPLP